MIRIEIPNYIREVKVAEKQRPIYVYYDNNRFYGKVLKRYFKFESRLKDYKEFTIDDLNINYTVVYILKNKLYFNYLEYQNHCKGVYLSESEFLAATKKVLYDMTENRFVISNINQQGKPRFVQIKGQDIYSGNLSYFTRAVIMSEIKNSFKPFLLNIEPVKKYPIKILMELHDTIENSYGRDPDQRWDVDNRAYPYCKAFPDVLTDLGIIEDDDRLHITQPPVPLFCPISKDATRKLVFIITQDDRNLENFTPNFDPKKYSLNHKK